MTKVIIISEGNLDSFYEQTLQYFQDTYHNYPTSLTGKPVSASEYSQISHYDSAARGHSSSIEIPADVNFGKDVF